MKKLIFTLFVMIAFVTKGVVVEFPDANFKAAILSQYPAIDDNADGDIEDTEAEAYSGDFTFEELDITDLTGLEAFVNLNYLTIKNCFGIAELDVSANTALQGLECSFTGITYLDLSNRTFTEDVTVTNNSVLTNINLDNSNMQWVSFADCGLTEGDFVYLVVETLNLSGNSFVELDFGTSQIGELGLMYNDDLTYLNLNNGTQEEFLESGLFGGAITIPLELPELDVVCIEEIGNATQIALEDILTEPVTFIDDCEFVGNTYFGTISYDADGDGCGADEGMSSVLLQAFNDTYNFTVSSDISGAYSVNIYEDIPSSYTISVIGLPDYFSVSPEEVISDFVTYGNEEELNFCIEAIEDVDDVSISFLSIVPANPGFTAEYQLIYKNMGTSASTGQISLTYDDGALNFTTASPAADIEDPGMLTFSYADLMPLETRVIDLEFLVEEPPIVGLDDLLEFDSAISPSGVFDDATPEDNQYFYIEEVVGSYDPNDVTVMEGEELLIDDAHNYLNYRIRFQNTGTAPAVNVRVENSLDDHLDWSTLQLLSTSHTSHMEIENEQDLVFYFDGINLADSLTDEPNSHGFITYRIKPKEGIEVGDIIENQAAIYFDFNLPIITNTATTEIVEPKPPISVTELSKLDYILYPIPVTDILNISTSSKITQIDLVNEWGQLLISEENTTRIDLSGLSKGLYFVKLVDENGNSGIQKLIKQ